MPDKQQKLQLVGLACCPRSNDSDDMGVIGNITRKMAILNQAYLKGKDRYCAKVSTTLRPTSFAIYRYMHKAVVRKKFSRRFVY